MKKVLLSTVAFIAFAAPAAAADLAARPYTKAPPAPIAVVYDWSGFYIGANGGWGSSRKCWDLTNDGVDPVVPAVPRRLPRCNRRHRRWSARLSLAGRQLGVRSRSPGQLGRLQGSNVSLFDPTVGNHSRIDAFGLFTGQVGWAANNVLFYVKGGAAVTADRFRQFDVPTGLSLPAPATTPAGVAWSARASNSASPRTGRPASNTITCSCRTAPKPSSTRPASFFATDRIRQDVDLVTVRVNYRWGGPVIAKY